MLRRASVLGVLAVAALGLSACGPSGRISGRVVVEGGSAVGVLVRILGPTSVGVVTDDTGAFKAEALPDGSYQVLADVPNTDVPTQRAQVKVANGTAPEVTLTFKASVGVVEGKVLFADTSDSAGLTVTLAGTESRGVQTATGGAYRFEGLKAGAYAVSVEVPDSRERRQSLSVLVGAGSPAGPLPDITFTLTGTLTGNVKAGTTNAPGATVEVPGTDRSAVTDAGGNFVLYDVPAGARTVQARLNAATASQQVTVTRGVNAALAFTLQTALTGRIEGTVGFASGVVDTLIRVSAAGTTYSTTAAVNGEWSLTVPPGTWDMVADAPNYPRKSLGLAVVSPGQTTAVPAAKISLYRKIPWEASVSGASPAINFSCEGDYLLGSVFFAGDNWLTLINHTTLSRRTLASSSHADLELSAKCKFAAWSMGANVFVHELATGVQRVFAGAPTNGIQITLDEAFLFYRTGTTLHRINLATFQDDTFSANAYLRLGRERHLVSNSVVSPITYNLVTRSGSVAAFPAVTNVGTLSGNETGVAWATTNCNTALPPTCTLQVLGPTATSPATVANPASVPQNPGIDSSNSTPDWLHFTNPGGTLFSILVKTDTAQAVAMPQTTTWIRFSPTGSRVAYISNVTLGQALREEVVPPSGTVAAATSTNATFDTGRSGWVSSTRLLVWDTAAAPRRLDFKSGTMTVDADLTGPIGSTVAQSNGVATWARASTSKRVALVGDSADFVLDSPGVTTYGLTLTPALPPVSLATTITPGGPGFPRHAGISTDINTTFVVDGARNEVRRLSGYYVAGGFFGWVFLVSGAAGVSGLSMVMPTTDQVVPIIEPGLGSPVAALMGASGIAFLTRDTGDARAVMLAKVNPAAP